MRFDIVISFAVSGGILPTAMKITKTKAAEDDILAMPRRPKDAGMGVRCETSFFQGTRRRKLMPQTGEVP